MKKIRKNLKVLTVLMSLNLLIVSCNKYEESFSFNSEKFIKHSGEDILAGLFFFKNDIGSRISVLNSTHRKIQNFKESKPMFIDAMNDLFEITITHINKKYPYYFEELQEIMYSNNLFKIEEALNTTVKIIEQSILTSEKYSSAYLIGKSIGQDEKLMSEIADLNLDTDEGIIKFKQLLLEAKMKDSNKETDVDVVFFAGAVAVFYVGVAAVSIAVAAYSVVTKVAYWDPFEYAEKLIFEKKTLSSEIVVAEISDYFSSQN